MKFFGIFLLLVVAVAANPRPNKRSVIDDGIASLVEQIRDMLINGHEEMGIPVVEPLEIDSYDFDVNVDDIALKGTAKDLRVDGLSTFEAGQLSFNLIGIRFNYCFAWASITARSRYSVDGIVIDAIPVYGEGDLETELTDLEVCGTLRLSVSGGFLNVRSSESTISLGGFDLKITGLLNDEDVSELISAAASDVVPQMINDYQTRIANELDKVIVSVGNGVLGTMTLGDLIALIRP